jgi:molecular chaperone DnaK
VLFRIDTNGILNVQAKNLRTGESHEIEVKPSYGISDAELENMLESAHSNAQSDMQSRQLVDARIEAETIIRAAEKAIAGAGHLVSQNELAQVKARLVDLKNQYQTGTYLELRQAIEDFDMVSHDLAEVQVNQALSVALPGRKV